MGLLNSDTHPNGKATSFSSGDGERLVDSRLLGIEPEGKLSHARTATQALSESTKGWEATTPTKRKRLSGWRLGAISSSILAMLTFIINIAVMAWLASCKSTNTNLIETYEGDCDKVASIDTWTHLAINALGTMLLGGSNYCMQVLSSPTRSAIDKAHSQRTFLDIGVPSFRNLWSVGRFRAVLWWTLALSSLPLHLLYNSAFYKSLSTTDYGIYLVSPEFVQGVDFDYDIPSRSRMTGSTLRVQDPALVQQQLHDPGHYERLENADCIREYGEIFLTGRRNVVLVGPKSNATHPVQMVEAYNFSSSVVGDNRPFEWICTYMHDFVNTTQEYQRDRRCQSWVSKLEPFADEWRVFSDPSSLAEIVNYPVSHCFSERIPQTCSYHGNLPILIIVVFCNAAKVVAMLLLALRLKQHPLTTIGDAIESFLDKPDEYTSGMCMLNKNKLVESWDRHRDIRGGMDESHEQPMPVPFAKVVRPRWFQAASKRRLLLTVLFILGAMTATAYFLERALGPVREAGSSITQLGLGRTSTDSVINRGSIGGIQDSTGAIIAAVLVSNVPQVILSFVYLYLNGFLTCMFLALEWDTFGRERRALRVSDPKGEQRSKHFLSLPYKIGVPLLIVSSLLHWLISQSIFLVVVSEYAPTGELEKATAIATCGFSPLGIILVLSLGCCVLVVTATLGLRQFRSYIPLAGSCSAVISAACHRPSWDVGPALRPLKWGEIPEAYDEAADEGHCAFSSGEVWELEEWRSYGGGRPPLLAPQAHPAVKVQMSVRSLA